MCYLIYQFLNLGIYSAIENHLSWFIDVLTTRVYIDLNLSNILARNISITFGCLHYLRNTDNYCKPSCIFVGISGSKLWIPIRKLFVLEYTITSLELLTDVTKTLNKWRGEGVPLTLLWWKGQAASWCQKFVFRKLIFIWKH